METLIIELKEQIIKALDLEDIEPNDIETDEPLFKEGLGLDSIDALEIIIMLEKNYGIKIDKPEQSKEILYSVATLAKYIQENKK